MRVTRRTVRERLISGRERESERERNTVLSHSSERLWKTLGAFLFSSMFPIRFVASIFERKTRATSVWTRRVADIEPPRGRFVRSVETVDAIHFEKTENRTISPDSNSHLKEPDEGIGMRVRPRRRKNNALRSESEYNRARRGIRFLCATTRDETPHASRNRADVVTKRTVFLFVHLRRGAISRAATPRTERNGNTVRTYGFV